MGFDLCHHGFAMATKNMKNMETILQRLVKEMSRMSEHRLRIFWEYHMIQRGMIPAVSPGVSNDRFGYIHNNQWNEWRIPSVETIRKYWDSLVAGTKTASSLDPLFDQLLAFLPGNKMTCFACRWKHIPETAMYNRSLCCACTQLLNPLDVRIQVT
jgi:hypothetical protein